MSADGWPRSLGNEKRGLTLVVEDEYAFACPYCGAEVTITVEVTAGRRQAFSYDCEVCCRPIVIRLEVGLGGVTSFRAEHES